MAKHAQVSPATVSRVINQPEKVSQERVRAVRRAMKALDYSPAPLSNRRGPKSRQIAAKSVGVWFVGAQQTPSLNWFQDQVIQMRPSMTRCRVHVSMYYSETNAEIPSPIRQREVDGVIIQGMEPASSCWPVLREMPNVWFMTRRSTDYPGDYVEPDNLANGLMAADYLISRGHSRLVALNTDPDYSAIAIRTDAFLQHCGSRRISASAINGTPKDHPAYLDTHPRDGEVNTLVRRWAAMSPRPTGVYLPADHFCGSFLRAARHLDLKPERDFELILGNRSPMIYPNLSYQPTAIDINLPTLVKMVVDHLLWRIDNFNSPGRVGLSVTPTLRPAPGISLAQHLDMADPAEFPSAVSL
ncbi:MAG: LacI family DNA-binding transcriptional regulator [Opitutaceae bacterium]